MEARAKLSYARISSRKVKIVIDMIRNKPVGEAMGILKNTPKAASELLIKLLNSAAANARKQPQHGQKQPLCCRSLCKPGTDLEKSPPQGTGQSVQN